MEYSHGKVKDTIYLGKGGENNMNGFFSFISSGTGRVVRIVAGLLIIAFGWFVVGGTGGTILAVVGVLPLLAGLFDWCIFAPLFGLPFVGEQLRKAVQGK